MARLACGPVYWQGNAGRVYLAVYDLDMLTINILAVRTTQVVLIFLTTYLCQPPIDFLSQIIWYVFPIVH